MHILHVNIQKQTIYLPFDDRPDCGMCHDDGDDAQFETGFNAGGLLAGKFICCPIYTSVGCIETEKWKFMRNESETLNPGMFNSSNEAILTFCIMGR